MSEILTMAEACEFLHVTRNTLNRLALDGTIPGRKIGRQWRFSLRTLREYVERGERDAKGRGE